MFQNDERLILDYSCTAIKYMTMRWAGHVALMEELSN
jgi:hypothetical protein